MKELASQGTQYTSIAFGLRCKEAGVRPSMGSVGDAYDNPMCESFREVDLATNETSPRLSEPELPPRLRGPG